MAYKSSPEQDLLDTLTDLKNTHTNDPVLQRKVVAALEKLVQVLYDEEQ